MEDNTKKEILQPVLDPVFEYTRYCPLSHIDLFRNFWHTWFDTTYTLLHLHVWDWSKKFKEILVWLVDCLLTILPFFLRQTLYDFFSQTY